MGTYAFAWQIYGDFAGYSNIARGAAQLMGFHFMVNFRQPYLAITLQDFWRRWHISLSTWLRDYLYIPLGGNRQSTWRTYSNLLTTMLIGGLWHGANWTFVVWGGIHGGGLALERLLGVGRHEHVPARPAVTWAKRILLFNLVCFAWIFFRAASIRDAFSFLAGLGTWQWQPEYLIALEVSGSILHPHVLDGFTNGTPYGRIHFSAFIAFDSYGRGNGGAGRDCVLCRQPGEHIYLLSILEDSFASLQHIADRHMRALCSGAGTRRTLLAAANKSVGLASGDRTSSC